MKAVQRMLGHASAAMTLDVYAELFEDDLDEVAAGLNPGEIEDIMASIRHIHGQLGVAVILIEHVMELVMRTSDRLIVLDSGRKIAEGLPDEIARNERVIKAYLGERYVQEHSGEGL